MPRKAITVRVRKRYPKKWNRETRRMLNRKKYEQKEDDKNRDLLNSLHSKGIIDADGNIMA